LQHQVSSDFEALSIEVQHKVNTIVSGLGVRERRSSFRKAVNKEVQPQPASKNYEKIWPQQQQQEYVQQVYGKITTPVSQRRNPNPSSAERPTPTSRKQLSQQEQMQQLAMAKALSSRPPDPRALVARLYGGPTPSEFTPANSVYATKNNGTCFNHSLVYQTNVV
jgi:hypothetical protein